MTKYIVFLVIFSAVCALPYSAHAQEMNRGSRYFPVDRTGKRQTLLKDQPFIATINGIGNYGVVALNPSASDEVQVIVKAFAINYSSAGSSNVNHPGNLDQITALSDEAVRLENNRLVVNANAQLNRKVVVHITLPSDSKIELFVDGKILRRGSVGTGLIARGQEVIEGGKGGLKPSETMALMQAINIGIAKGRTPPLDPETIVGPKPGRPEHTVPWRMLRSRFIEQTTPTFSGSTQSRAVVEIFVNRNGDVTNVVTIDGDQELANVASEALKRWRFRPFYVQGAAVDVRSIIFLTSTNGRLRLGN